MKRARWVSEHVFYTKQKLCTKVKRPWRFVKPLALQSSIFFKYTAKRSDLRKKNCKWSVRVLKCYWILLSFAQSSALLLFLHASAFLFPRISSAFIGSKNHFGLFACAVLYRFFIALASLSLWEDILQKETKIFFYTTAEMPTEIFCRITVTIGLYRNQRNRILSGIFGE